MILSFSLYCLSVKAICYFLHWKSQKYPYLGPVLCDHSVFPENNIPCFPIWFQWRWDRGSRYTCGCLSSVRKVRPPTSPFQTQFSALRHTHLLLYLNLRPVSLVQLPWRRNPQFSQGGRRRGGWERRVLFFRLPGGRGGSWGPSPSIYRFSHFLAFSAPEPPHFPWYLTVFISWGCHTKYHRLGGSKQQNFIVLPLRRLG